MNAPASKLVKGQTGDWEVVIGMEVHAQVLSNSKLFSGASTEFGGEPNSHVSFIDAGFPGMLPVINEKCIEQAVHFSLMTGSMPGKPASMNDTLLLGSLPNSVEAPENSLEWERTWAWTSMPITISHSPVSPFNSLFFATAFIWTTIWRGCA